MMTEHVHSPDKLFLRLAETADKACKLTRYFTWNTSLCPCWGMSIACKLSDNNIICLSLLALGWSIRNAETARGREYVLEYESSWMCDLALVNQCDPLWSWKL
jgi:hypothetical protein